MTRPTSITRRTLLNSTALAVTGSWAARFGLAAEPSDAATEPPPVRRRTKRGPVWVATFCQEKLRTDSPDAMIARVLREMHEVVPQQPDILCLPECFHAANVSERPPLAELAEQPPGRYSRPFAEFAKQHRVNIICPIYTVEEGRIFNAAVVIDREGKYVGEYRKINPTDGEIQAGITPGPIDPPVFALDCATIGIQICFDVNWPENWRRLGDKGAEIVFWPSAFAGGQMLNSHAWMNKYYVVSSTRIRATTMVDPLGDSIEHTGRFGTWLCRPLNLDYAVIQGWQDINKLNAVRAEYGRAIDVRIKHVEALALLTSLSPEHSAQEICREFEIETSREMLKRNTLLQDRHRGSLDVP